MEVLSSRVILVTADLPKTRNFYENTLGLKVFREYGTGGAVTGVVFFLGGGFLELATGSAATPAASVVLWLQVPDLMEEERRLLRAGVTVKKPAERMPWGLEEMWITDPHGFEIRVVEVPSDHPLRQRLA